LATGLEKFEGKEKVRLLNGLAEAQVGNGNFAEADRLWAQLLKEDRGNVRIHLQRFDLAVYADNDEALPELVAGIRNAEGEEGTLWRYAEALRILRQVRRGEKSTSKVSFSDARRFLEDVARRRPTWSRVPLLQAGLAEVEEQPAKALEFYRKALE